MILTFASGCATTEAVPFHEVNTVYQDRIVPVPESLTDHSDIMRLPEGFDLIDVGVWGKFNQVRLEQCYSRLDEIRGLGR